MVFVFYRVFIIFFFSKVSRIDKIGAVFFKRLSARRFFHVFHSKSRKDLREVFVLFLFGDQLEVNFGSQPLLTSNNHHPFNQWGMVQLCSLKSLSSLYFTVKGTYFVYTCSSSIVEYSGLSRFLE